MNRGASARSPFNASQPRFVLALSVFVLALAVRIAYLIALSRTPFLSHPLLDARLYDLWAQRLAAGDWLGKEVFYANPLYPHYLGALYALIGRNLVLVHLVQHLLASLGAALLAVTGVRLFDRRVGALAGLAAAFYAPFVFHEGTLTIESLAPFLGILTLFLLARAGERRSLPAWLAAGMVNGLFVLARPNLTPVAGVLWALVKERRRGRQRALSAGALLLGAALAIAPVTIRNWLVAGEFVPITAHGGETFYVGNYAGSDGYGTQPPFVDSGPATEHESFRREASKRLGREVSLAESSRFWRDRAFSFAIEEPARYLGLLARKIYLFLHAYEKGDNASFHFMRAEVPTLRWIPLGFGIVAPLALLGLWVTRREWSRMGIVPLFGGTYTLGVILFFVLSRYRLPAVPSFLLLAAAAAVWLYDRLRARRFARAAIAGAALLVLALITNLRTDLVTPDSISTVHNNYGLVLEESGDLDGAARQYAAAARIAPGYPLYAYNLGKVERMRGRDEVARTLFLTAIRLDPDYSDAHASLGYLYEAEGKLADALGEYMRAAELDPTLVGPALNAAVLLEREGRTDEAEVMYRRALAASPESYRENVGLGLFLVRSGRPCEALPHFARARPVAPGPAVAGRLDSLLGEFRRSCAGGAEP